jgi:hypothetical protein
MTRRTDMTTSTPRMDDESTVRTLLAVAGIPVPEDEIASVVVEYGRLKTMIATLHAVEEARYESPGLHFDPAPIFADWG